MKITTRGLEELSRKASQTQKNQFLWDTGFGAKASPKGTISWLKQTWRGGRNGKASRVVLGHYPQMPLTEAYTKFYSPSTQEGKGTLRDTIALYLTKNAKPGSYWCETGQYFERDVIRILGADTLISKITKADVRYVIDTKYEAAPIAARNLFSALRSFFNWCVEMDLLDKAPISGIKQPPKACPRDRVLTDDEIRVLWKDTDTLPLYRILLLTGQRLGEVSNMTWSQLSLEKGIWIIPSSNTKSKREHLVHLSPMCLSILASISRKCDYVFPNSINTPTKSYARAKKDLDRLIPIASWRLHDLRRTCASGMASIGIQPYIIERILNHSLPGLIGVYQRYDYAKERKEALEAWGTHVEKLVGNFC